MSRYLFFEQSQAAYEQITDLFDFVWPTAAAMWNLRWQVSGYVAAYPEATVEDIERRFVLGSKIHGANLRRACVDMTWPEQQARFAKFLLVDTFAIYESWIAGVLGTLRSDTKANEKDLQFPSSVSAKGTSQGVSACLARLHANSSSVIQKAFYPTLLQHLKNSKKNLENLLGCYRYFKECRNVLVHNGGSCTQTTVEAYTAFLTVATPSMLDMREEVAPQI